MCNVCQDLGYLFDDFSPDNKKRGLRICDCISAKCKCNKENPYIYYEGIEPGRCSCARYRAKLEKVKFAFKNAGLSSLFRFKFFNDFNTIGPNGKIDDNLFNLKHQVMDIYHNFQPGQFRKGIFISGNTGTGKTLLATILLNELILKFAIKARFLRISYDFFQTLRNTYNENSPEYGMTKEIFDSFIAQEILVIDDFGVQRNSDWELEMLYNLIDMRYQERKTTFFTTNQSLEEIKGVYEGRIYSRIMEMCLIINIKAPDYREKLNKEAQKELSFD